MMVDSKGVSSGWASLAGWVTMITLQTRKHNTADIDKIQRPGGVQMDFDGLYTSYRTVGIATTKSP